MLLPVIVSIFYIIWQSNKELSFARKEMAGLTYIVEVSKLVDLIQMNRTMVIMNYLGYSDSETNIEQQLIDIEKQIKNIDIINDKYGASIDSSRRWLVIRKDWKAEDFFVASRSEADLDVVVSNHEDYINKLLLFNISLADGSNLMLDAGPDSYYLMSLSVLDAPFFVENYLNTLIYLLRSDKIDNFFLQNLTEQHALHFEKVKRSMSLVFSKDIKAHEVLSEKLQKMESKYLANNEMIYAVINGISSPSAQNIFFELRSTHADMSSTYSLIFSNLKSLLSNRIDNLIFYRNFTTAIIIIFLTMYFYLFFALYRSLEHVIAKLRDLGDRIENKETKADSITLDVNDEMGDVVNSFNLILTQLSKTNFELEKQIKAERELKENLLAKTDELEKFNKLMIGRELKMSELKEEISKFKLNKI